MSWKWRLPFFYFFVTIIFRMCWLSLQYITIFFHWFNLFFYFFICLDQQWRKMMETVANDLYHFQNPPKLLIILYFWKFSLASFMHQSFNRGEILWKLISEKWKFGIKFSQQKNNIMNDRVLWNVRWWSPFYMNLLLLFP